MGGLPTELDGHGRKGHRQGRRRRDRHEQPLERGLGLEVRRREPLDVLERRGRVTADLDDLAVGVRDDEAQLDGLPARGRPDLVAQPGHHLVVVRQAPQGEDVADAEVEGAQERRVVEP